MKRIVLLLFLVPSIALGQDPKPLGKGEFYGALNVAKAKGGQEWFPGASFGLALPVVSQRVPVLVEYVSGASSNTTPQITLRFVGAGIRIDQGSLFGAVTAGAAHYADGLAFNGTDVASSTGGAAMSLSGGVNWTVKPHWGVRGEVRTTTVFTTGASQWLYQFGGGLFYRFGKK
jgi:hypothetical protein